VIAPTAIGVLITVATALLVLSFRRLEGLDDELEGWLDLRYAHESAGREAALARLIRGIWVDITDGYLRSSAFESAPITPDSLRAAAASMDADPSVKDVRSRELIVEPILRSIGPDVVRRSERIAAAVVNLPDTDESISALACHDLDMEMYRSAGRRLMLLYGLQLAIAAVLLATTIGILWLPLAALATVAVGIVSGLPVHVLALELWRLRVKWTLRVRKNVVDLGESTHGGN
jgi:hypothetical protein